MSPAFRRPMRSSDGERWDWFDVRRSRPSLGSLAFFFAFFFFWVCPFADTVQKQSLSERHHIHTLPQNIMAAEVRHLIEHDLAMRTGKG